jgi:GNAT superfamily N-acetyltransferase
MRNSDQTLIEPDIKIATLDDLKDIQKLNKQLFDEEFDKYDQTINCDWPLSKQGEAFYKERITDENSCAFILKTADNKTIGYLVGSLADDEFYRNVDNIAELDDMYIIEEFRSSGFGGKLYNAFISWCKEKSVKRVKVLVTAKNSTAISFYKKKGFLDHNVTLEASIEELK